MRRTRSIMGATALMLVLGGGGVAAQDVTELLARCQNEDMKAEIRVESCGKIAANAKLDAELRAEALLNRGVAYEALDKDDAAMADYTDAIGLNSEYSAPYGYRGALLEKVGRFEDAIKDLSTVLKLKPDDTEALYARGRLYLIVGEPKPALDDFEALMLVQSKDADALLGRAMAQEALGNKAAALTDYKAVLAIEADNEDAKDGVDRLSGG